MTVLQKRACAAIAVWAASCSGTPLPVRVEGSTAASVSRPKQPIWGRFEELRSFRAVTAPFESDHGGARHYAVIYASERAAAPYTALTSGAEMPIGAALVEALYERQKDSELAEPSFYLAMEKTDAGWHYLVLGAGGGVDSRDEHGLCRRCHIEAVSDELFGVGSHAPRLPHPQP